MNAKQACLSLQARFRYTQRFARQRPDETAGVAGLPSLPARDQRTGEDPQIVDTAQAR
jgi:hypothetical protein